MAKAGPGRSHRERLTVIQLLDMFPDDAAAEKWFEAQRWPEGRFCPDCGSTNTVPIKSRKPMPYRCRDCRNHFSVRKGTVMQSSKLGLRKWAIALYMTATGIKGTASMKVYREIGMRQATAWHLMHRIREAFDDGESLPFPGPVEADETYVGGKRKNMPMEKRATMTSRGTDGKATVVDVKDRATKQVTARHIARTDTVHVAGFVAEVAKPGANVFTDAAAAYNTLKPWYDQEVVNHSADEYVNPKTGAGTQGIESFWSLLKRGYHGTFHKISPKHLDRYVREFAARNNVRDHDTIERSGSSCATPISSPTTDCRAGRGRDESGYRAGYRRTGRFPNDDCVDSEREYDGGAGKGVATDDEPAVAADVRSGSARPVRWGAPRARHPSADRRHHRIGGEAFYQSDHRSRGAHGSARIRCSCLHLRTPVFVSAIP